MKRKYKLIAITLAIGALFGLVGQKASAITSIEESGAVIVATEETISEDPQDFQFGGNNTLEYDGDASDCRYFLGMTSWDCGLHDASWEEQNLKGTILQIITNIGSDLTILAAYLVLGFVIYGGYRYMLAGGDAAAVAAGKRTLFHAFVGLGIVMLSNIIFNAIRFGLLGGSTAEQKTIGGVPVTVGTTTGATLFTSSIQWIIGIAGVVALIFIVYGGILYMTANGESGKVKKAKDTILYASIGLIIVALAEAITGFVTAKINEAKTKGTASETAIVRVIGAEEINHEEAC